MSLSFPFAYTMSYQSERTFKILIYESEYQQIQAWTNKHEDVETGGDLFGLWQDDRTAVVQLVLGPGKQCRRTSASFYQDVDYLKRVGDILTEEGLCHIGEWHSHHTLNLSRPSGGDESTIWSNMDRYSLSRFVLFIANIRTTWSWFHVSYLPDETTVNGFLFEVDCWRSQYYRLPVLQAEFVFLSEESPFRSKCLNAIEEGAESMNTAQDQLKKSQQMKSGWEKALQENNKLQKSLAAEQNKRKETDKRLRNSEDQTYTLQRSLSAERQAKEDTCTEQRSHELETSLAAEREARKEADRKLQSIGERTCQLELSLVAQTRAREEAEQTLQSVIQQSQHIFESAAAARQAKEVAERRLNSSLSEKRARELELETSLLEERQAREETERRLNSSEQRARELETSLLEERQAREELKASLAEEQKAHEEARRETSRDWLLDRKEIILSNTMREEEWGRVVGSFCKAKVAVKVVQKHDLLCLDECFFEREMKKAFVYRHPCILQFIGVTFDHDQSLLFVSELPDTSLSAISQKRPLETSEVATIALDVAKGLNYLHLKHDPDPIVHGYINSANVLLWERGGAVWQAKISDFSTINFLQQAVTNFSFDNVYTAPEAHTYRSTKVDVYSFGVLLWEMNLREVPDRNKNLDQQIARVPCHYRRLIKRCMREDPEKRLSMEEIIEKIEKIQ